MRTVAQQWAEFEKLVLPPDAGRTQRTEMRRAFYAGFQGALMAGIEMADESKDSDDIGVTMIQRLHDECQQFACQVAAGRA
jgi:hypothetical protein